LALELALVAHVARVAGGGPPFPPKLKGNAWHPLVVLVGVGWRQTTTLVLSTMGDQASGGKGKLSQLSIFEAKKGEEEATNKKAASASGAGGTRFVPPEGDRCDVCGKRVYVAEKLEADGRVFHKSCFRCTHCNNPLKLGTYASLQGKYYCKPHFKQLFALKGNYAEGFGEKKPQEVWMKGKEGGGEGEISNSQEEQRQEQLEMERERERQRLAVLERERLRSPRSPREQPEQRRDLEEAVARQKRDEWEKREKERLEREANEREQKKAREREERERNLLRLKEESLLRVKEERKQTSASSTREQELERRVSELEEQLSKERAASRRPENQQPVATSKKEQELARKVKELEEQLSKERAVPQRQGAEQQKTSTVTSNKEQELARKVKELEEQLRTATKRQEDQQLQKRQQPISSVGGKKELELQRKVDELQEAVAQKEREVKEMQARLSASNASRQKWMAILLSPYIACVFYVIYQWY